MSKKITKDFNGIFGADILSSFSHIDDLQLVIDSIREIDNNFEVTISAISVEEGMEVIVEVMDLDGDVLYSGSGDDIVDAFQELVTEMARSPERLETRTSATEEVDEDGFMLDEDYEDKDSPPEDENYIEEEFDEDATFDDLIQEKD